MFQWWPVGSAKFCELSPILPFRKIWMFKFRDKVDADLNYSRISGFPFPLLRNSTKFRGEVCTFSSYIMCTVITHSFFLRYSKTEFTFCTYKSFIKKRHTFRASVNNKFLVDIYIYLLNIVISLEKRNIKLDREDAKYIVWWTQVDWRSVIT